MKKEFWISAYDQYGRQFGDSIKANDVDEMFRIFREKNPYCDIADYGEYEEDDNDMNNNEILNTIKINIENASERSAWKRGVKTYAFELWERIEELIDDGYYTTEDLFSAEQINKMLLNGAPNWNKYSWGGCSLIYDGDIAERLCTPYELKRTKHGQLKPNNSEEWLDTQERALKQAATIILNAIKKAR